MLDVEHLVIEDVLNNELRNGRMIHSAIEKDLIRARIVATELAAPGSPAPAQIRADEVSPKEFPVQRIEHLGEIEKPALRIGCRGADARAAHALDALASALRVGVVEVRLRERFRRTAAINSREQKRCSAFENRQTALAH